MRHITLAILLLLPSCIMGSTLDERLSSACVMGDEVRAAQLIKAGADVNYKNKAGWTPLHYATSCGPDLVKLLVDAGADVNSTDIGGQTPLHAAAFYKDGADVVRLLLESGADPAATDSEGRTPLDRALNGGNQESARLLEAYGK